jgi:hypothetical protein
MNSKHLRELVVRPVLDAMAIEFPKMAATVQAAEDFLVMVAAHESKLGEYLKQISGPALGIFQIEPKTADWLGNDYLQNPRRAQLRDLFLSFYAPGLSLKGNLAANLAFQVATARILLWSKSEPLPKPENYPAGREDSAYIDALAAYAKTHWNTDAGKAHPKDYRDAYLRTL